MAVHGLMMLSDGEMKVLFLQKRGRVDCQLGFVLVSSPRPLLGLWRVTYSPSSILDWKTWRWCSMLITSGLMFESMSMLDCVWAGIDVLTSLAASTLEDIFSIV